MQLAQRIAAGLAQRRAQHLDRALRTVPDGVIDLASNDYLGLAVYPEVIEAACAAARDCGAGARASRLVSGHTAIHAALEAELAAFKSDEAALVFPSGYQANIAVLTALTAPGDTIFCHKRNHASLIDACRLAHDNGVQVRYFGDHEKLRALLARTARDACCFIVTDTVFSMDGDIADIAGLAHIAGEFGATLVLDDAHGTGTLGLTGRGVTEHCPVAGAEYVVVGTLSKAIGSQGGFVTGSRALIEWFTNTARPFVYTTGINPAACGAALQALRILRREPERVTRMHELKNRLADGLTELGYDVRRQPTPILPLIVGDPERAVALSQALLERGIWCPAIRTPTVPAGTDRLRVTATVGLSAADLDHILTAFASARGA